MFAVMVKLCHISWDPDTFFIFENLVQTQISCWNIWNAFSHITLNIIIKNCLWLHFQLINCILDGILYIVDHKSKSQSIKKLSSERSTKSQPSSYHFCLYVSSSFQWHPAITYFTSLRLVIQVQVDLSKNSFTAMFGMLLDTARLKKRGHVEFKRSYALNRSKHIVERYIDPCMVCNVLMMYNEQWSKTDNTTMKSWEQAKNRLKRKTTVDYKR